MLRILQIAYYFPPMGGAGVQRALKFSKYLPRFGVQPVVLAAHDPDYVSDASLAAEVPGDLEVHRVEHRPLLQRIVRWRQGCTPASSPAPLLVPSLPWREGRGEGPRGGTSGGGGPSPQPAPRGRGGPMVRDAFLRTYATLQFPDDKAAWARRALPIARGLLRDRPFDLIFSSSPPVSAHALAARLSREFGLPWVADYRDLWTEISSHGAPAWRAAIDRRVEAGWLRQAAGVVTVTPSWQRMLARRLGPSCPVAFIPNGYDEADFASLANPPVTPPITPPVTPPVTPPADPREFVLVHTGTFYGPRDPGALLDGVALYLQRTPSPTRRLRVRLVGNIGARFDARLRAFDALHPGMVERVPYLPHREALAELMRADALLLVVGGWGGAGGAGLLPGKIFEYLRARKPVLLLGAARGDAADLVREHAHGHVVDETPDAIARALREMVAESADTPPRDTPPSDVTRFERRELARQLAEFLIRCKGAAR